MENLDVMVLRTRQRVRAAVDASAWVVALTG